MMFAKYFEYYTIILRGGAFFRGHAVDDSVECWYLDDVLLGNVTFSGFCCFLCDIVTVYLYKVLFYIHLL